MTDLQRFSFSIEKTLAKKLEQLGRANHYANRSEFIRDLIRHRQVEAEWEDDAEVLGTVTLLYDHHQRQLSEKLIEVQHHHPASVLASTHVHLSDRLCAEMIMVRGKAGEVRHMFDHMRQEKGVLHASLSLGTTGEMF